MEREVECEWIKEDMKCKLRRDGMTHQFLRLSLASSCAPTSKVIPLLLGGVLLILSSSVSCKHTHTHTNTVD